MAEVRRCVVSLSDEDEQRIKRLAEILDVNESKVVRMAVAYYEETLLELARRIMKGDPGARCREVAGILGRMEDLVR